MKPRRDIEGAGHEDVGDDDGNGPRPVDPFSPDHIRDPYPAYSKLRADTAARFVEDLGVWLVSRYEDVRAAFGDPEGVSSALTLLPVLPVCPHAGRLLGDLTNDPVTVRGDGPGHVRTRRALMATFPSSPRKAAAYDPMIRGIVAELTDKMQARGEADLVRDFTWELPVRVLLRLLGVPSEDHEHIKRWGDGRAAILFGRMNDADQVRLANDANAFWEYCRQLTAKRIAEPGDDCLSALLAYRADDAVLTEREVASFAFDLLAAGHETTSNLLSNGLLQLLTGGAWEELLAHPSRIPAAVEEILRYDPPLLGWLHVTTRPCLVGDVEIPAGQRVTLLLGSANHDERREDADRFDIGRVNAADHLSFGLGRHFCPARRLRAWRRRWRWKCSWSACRDCGCVPASSHATSRAAGSGCSSLCRSCGTLRVECTALARCWTRSRRTSTTPSCQEGV